MSDESPVVSSTKPSAAKKSSADDYSPEHFISQITDLKLKIGKHLGGISDEILNRLETLKKLGEQIEAKEKELLEIEEIKIAGKNLADILEAQKKAKEEFLSEIEKAKKDWRREQEEYEYQKSQAAKRDAEEFSERKRGQDRELKDREEILTKGEAELKTLRDQAAGLQKEIETAAKEASENLKAKLEAEFAAERKLIIQSHDSEKKILELRISSLDDLVKKLQKESEYLREQAERAGTNLKEMAIEALKGREKSPESSRGDSISK